MKWKTLGVLLCVAAARLVAQEPPWNPNAIKECDRACDRRAHDREHRSVRHENGYQTVNNPPPGGALILDEQKQTVGTFPLFVHDGTGAGAASDVPPGMLQNLVTMETFSVRGGLIHHFEAAPFVTIPYGLGNGWTPGIRTAGVIRTFSFHEGCPT
jgi:hypothetical protein